MMAFPCYACGNEIRDREGDGGCVAARGAACLLRAGARRGVWWIGTRRARRRGLGDASSYGGLQRPYGICPDFRWRHTEWLGWRSERLEGRERGDCRALTGGKAGGNHVRHLARRRAGGFRSEGGSEGGRHRGEYRDSVPQ